MLARLCSIFVTLSQAFGEASKRNINRPRRQDGKMADSGKQFNQFFFYFADLFSEQTPTPENMTMMQGFEWYVPDDHKHWVRLHDNIPQLKAAGIDNIWVPPGCKASSPSGNGYDIYDLYDLGEFDQKGGKATKWGTKEELVAMVKKANEVGVGIYWDAGMWHICSSSRPLLTNSSSPEPQSRCRPQGEVRSPRSRLR